MLRRHGIVLRHMSYHKWNIITFIVKLPELTHWPTENAIILRWAMYASLQFYLDGLYNMPFDVNCCPKSFSIAIVAQVWVILKPIYVVNNPLPAKWCRKSSVARRKSSVAYWMMYLCSLQQFFHRYLDRNCDIFSYSYEWCLLINLIVHFRGAINNFGSKWCVFGFAWIIRCPIPWIIRCKNRKSSCHAVA